jgi:hypothetical protein
MAVLHGTTPIMLLCFLVFFLDEFPWFFLCVN